MLVEEAALTQAETECAGDAAARAAARARAGERRERLDEQYVALFAQRARELFPGCPPGLEVAIAEHACEKYSGRVGRSAAARNLDRKAVELAVTAHIRHAETDYDELLMRGCSREEARREVAEKVASVVRQWEGAR